MQSLKVFQSLWAMQALRSTVRPGSVEQAISLIENAGFDGISTAWLDADSARTVWEATRGTCLEVEGICLPKSIGDLERVLDFTARFPIRQIVIQADVRPRTLHGCADLIEGWLRLAGQVEFPIYLETHRDQLTNDLFFTLDLLQRYPQIKLLADISHYVVARGFVYPISDESDQAIRDILDRAWAYHGRVASNQQVQLEISFGGSEKWVEQFCSWWTYGFRSWRQRAAADETLTFVCELGPQPYATAGCDGLDLTDRWSEALQLRRLAQHCWQRACS